MIGTWCGGIFGMVLYVLFIHFFVTDNAALAIWITCATSALITSILSMVFFDHACVIGSALGGSYALVRVRYQRFHMFYRVFLNMQEDIQMSS